ncbi:MAG: Imm12 family immunity protein [Campylobacter sp.]
MKFNINAVIGGVDDVPIYMSDIIRAVRQEIKRIFSDFEMRSLQKIDICLCLSGEVSRYFPKSGIYQSRYYFKSKKIIAYIHFSSDEWSSDKRANADKFLEKFKRYLMELGDIAGRKIANNNLEFDDTQYKDNINKIFENLVVNC